MKATRRYIEAIAGAIAQEANVTIREGKSWVTDIRSRVIEYDASDLLNKEALEAKGLILHELGHLNYTTDTKTELGDKFSDMQSVYNTFEDARIESLMRGKFGDFAEQAFNSVHAIGLEMQSKRKLPSLGKILMAQLAIDAFETTQNYHIRELARQTYTKIVNSYTSEENIAHRGLMDVLGKVRRAEDTQELKKIVDKDVYPHIKEFIKNQPEGEGFDPHEKMSGGSKPNPESVSLPSDEELKNLLYPYIHTVSHKLNDILKETQATRFEGQHRSGKLLSKNAYKVITGEERIFSKKSTPHKPNYVMTLVLDESGSMEGKRHEYTYITSILLSEIAKKMGFKTNVVIYDNHIRVGKVEDYRSMNGGGNNDRLAMQKVKELTNKNDDNIVFVLTDGGVCTDPGKVLEEFEANNYIVAAIGVGLDENCTAALRTYYKHTIEAPDVEKLPTIMIQQLQKLIHR